MPLYNNQRSSKSRTVKHGSNGHSSHRQYIRWGSCEAREPLRRSRGTDAAMLARLLGSGGSGVEAVDDAHGAGASSDAADEQD